jgi:predicted dehydrogenase
MGLRVGVIGAGMVGALHARSALLAGAELAAVAAGSAASAERARDQLGFARAYADPLELIADERIDVVHICTPNHLHVELATAAIAAGKHVVCEKPLAIEAAAAAAAGVIAAVPFVYRFYPMVREARARVAAGTLGPVGLISGVYLQDWLAAAGSSNWRVDPALGGPSRAFADIGSHWCDLVEFVSGQRIAALSAQLRTTRSKRPRGDGAGPTFAPAAARPGDWAQVETEDVAVVSFRTNRDAVGSVVVSQVSPGAKNQLRFELTGEEATLSFDQQAPDQLLLGELERRSLIERDPTRLTPEAAPYATLPAGHPQGFADCFEAFVADVYRSIEAGAPVAGLPGFDAGARGVRLTEAVLRSGREESSWVEIEDEVVPMTSADSTPKLP